jgi:hypothetical protein
MSSVLDRCKTWLARAWRIDARLTACGLLMLGVLAACAVGLCLDPRTVLGAPVWLKPAKFALSISIYCATLVALFSAIPAFDRTRRVVSWTTLTVMLLEMGIIGAQAARGTTSHFNVSTPLNTVLFGIMGAAIVTQTLSSIAVAVALFRQRHADRALGWAMRLAMVIAIAGASIGGIMTRPTEQQLGDMRAGRALVSGAHTVGAPDGGPGVAVTGWSREHGDLRVAHFIGLHALQVLPLLALATRRTRLRQEQRVRLAWTAAGSYTAFVGLALWQALRGQPMLGLDPTALGALLGWAALTGAATWRALVGRVSPRAAALSAS